MTTNTISKVKKLSQKYKLKESSVIDRAVSLFWAQSKAMDRLALELKAWDKLSDESWQKI
jgi:hypothetical protein